MGETTGIAWTDSTFNPWVGCQRVSPGCVHCYAEAQDHRWRPGKERWGPTAERTRTSPANWRKPLQWNARATKLGIRHRVFCSSLADVFEDRAELAEWREELFGLIAATPMLDWQLLTKRPENIVRLWPATMLMPADKAGDMLARSCPPPGEAWEGVWLGTTVEDQQRAVERIPRLIAAPAVMRFLSCEPLLEDLTIDVPRGLGLGGSFGIDWVIIGGESGPGARPFELEWARSIIEQCRAGGARPFVKQLGASPFQNGAGVGCSAEMHLNDRAGADPAEWPEDLRVREFPEVHRE